MKDVKERLLLKSGNLKNIYNEASDKIRETEDFLKKAQIFVEAKLDIGEDFIAWAPHGNSWRIISSHNNEIRPFLACKVEHRIKLVSYLEDLLIVLDNNIEEQARMVKSIK